MCEPIRLSNKKKKTRPRCHGNDVDIESSQGYFIPHTKPHRAPTNNQFDRYRYKKKYMCTFASRRVDKPDMQAKHKIPHVVLLVCVGGGGGGGGVLWLRAGNCVSGTKAMPIKGGNVMCVLTLHVVFGCFWLFSGTWSSRTRQTRDRYCLFVRGRVGNPGEEALIREAIATARDQTALLHKTTPGRVCLWGETRFNN
jgi:hypothetical protein